MFDEKQEAPASAETVPDGAAAPPAVPELESAERHFSAGNFREARRLAEEALRSDDAETRAAAAAMIARLAPDRAALWIVAGCLLLFVAIVWLFVT